MKNKKNRFVIHCRDNFLYIKSMRFFKCVITNKYKNILAMQLKILLKSIGNMIPKNNVYLKSPLIYLYL